MKRNRRHFVNVTKYILTVQLTVYNDITHCGKTERGQFFIVNFFHNVGKKQNKKTTNVDDCH